MVAGRRMGPYPAPGTGAPGTAIYARGPYSPVEKATTSSGDHTGRETSTSSDRSDGERERPALNLVNTRTSGKEIVYITEN
jgi:hypothetical protein